MIMKKAFFGKTQKYCCYCRVMKNTKIDSTRKRINLNTYGKTKSLEKIIGKVSQIYKTHFLNAGITLMEKSGVYMAWDKCSSKWKSLNERYNEINRKLSKDVNGRKTPWPFYEKMNHLCGNDDRNTLRHVQVVGACGITHRIQNRNPNEEFHLPKKKMKTRISNAESLDCLIELEMKREGREEHIIETLKDQRDSRLRKDDTIISAAKSFQEVSAAIIAKLRQGRYGDYWKWVKDILTNYFLFSSIQVSVSRSL